MVDQHLASGNIKKVCEILSQRYQKRHGGYSRLLRAGFRRGDDAPMAIIELVDRDIKAKNVDVKKAKPKDSTEKPQIESKSKIKEKKPKSNK